MEIDVDLLEMIGKYEEGELTAKQSQKLLQKLKTDERYQFHQEVYQGIMQGLRNPASNPRKSVDEPLSPELEEALDQLVQDESKLSRLRLSGIVLTVLILVASAFWIGQRSSSEASLPLAQQDSVLQSEDEPEILFGNPGNQIVKNLDYQQWDAQTGQKNPYEGESPIKLLVIRPHEAFVPAYQIGQDSLYLYHREPADFAQAGVVLLEAVPAKPAESQYYLQIQSSIFPLKVSDQILFLGAQP